MLVEKKIKLHFNLCKILGYGLVSELCPAGTVACRIRIDHNAVDFYQYSSLYDRNQFVCVLRNEYGDIKQSGCVEKRTGNREYH